MTHTQFAKLTTIIGKLEALQAGVDDPKIAGYLQDAKSLLLKADSLAYHKRTGRSRS